MKWHCWSFGIFPIQPIQWRKDDYLYVCVCYCIYTAEEERPGTEHRQSNCKMDLVYVFLSYRPFSIQCIAWAPFVSSAIFIVISSNGIDLTLFANSSSHIQFHNIRFPFCLMQRSTLYCTVLCCTVYMYISLSMTTKNMFIAFIYRMPFRIFFGTQIFVCSLWMFTWRCVLLRCYSVGPMLQYTTPSSSEKHSCWPTSKTYLLSQDCLCAISTLCIPI